MRRKLFKLFFTSCAAFLLVFFPVTEAGSRPGNFSGKQPLVAGENAPARSIAEEASALFDSLGLDLMGLKEDAFTYAYKGYMRLLKMGKIARKGLLTICDFSQSSNNKRLYLVDIENLSVIMNTYVAHGRNSGGEFARSFSNQPRSHKSSLGFYITGKPYSGGNGFSLHLQGVEKGINDKAMARHIVMHGSDYATENFLNSNPFLGRSYGCPAVPEKDAKLLIETIKEGSCLFIYHPGKSYLNSSKLLNT